MDAKNDAVTGLSNDQLRRHFRTLRAEMDGTVLVNNAIQLCARVQAHKAYRGAQHIAAYVAIRGEVDLAALMQHAAMAQPTKQIYLPVLRDENMYFVPWAPGQPLVKKGFGLLEPQAPEQLWKPAAELDLVLAPLVVFDEHCNRIGQGGGYYDRTFEFRVGKPGKPVLMGVAHESQCVTCLQPASWDVPLDYVLTESASYCRR